MDAPLAEWQAAIKQHFDLVTDPEGHWRKLVDLAMLAHKHRQVCSGELLEMLELSDAAKLWALIEGEEAEAIGLLNGESVDTDDVSFFRNRGR